MSLQHPCNSSEPPKSGNALVLEASRSYTSIWQRSNLHKAHVLCQTQIVYEIMTLTLLFIVGAQTLELSSAWAVSPCIEEHTAPQIVHNFLKADWSVVQKDAAFRVVCVGRLPATTEHGCQQRLLHLNIIINHKHQSAQLTQSKNTAVSTKFFQVCIVSMSIQHLPCFNIVTRTRSYVIHGRYSHVHSRWPEHVEVFVQHLLQQGRYAE